jgi:hypothetical protein
MVLYTDLLLHFRYRHLPDAFVSFLRLSSLQTSALFVILFCVQNPRRGRRQENSWRLVNAEMLFTRRGPCGAEQFRAGVAQLGSGNYSFLTICIPSGGSRAGLEPTRQIYRSRALHTQATSGSLVKHSPVHRRASAPGDRGYPARPPNCMRSRGV